MISRNNEGNRGLIGFLEEFKRAYVGDDTQHYQVAGKEVRCPHCGGNNFDGASALLNTAGLTLLGLDWANRSAHVLICTACGHVDWFLQKPDRI
jgi:predicted nucleic-acid-binding Zn-ribbon protein